MEETAPPETNPQSPLPSTQSPVPTTQIPSTILIIEDNPDNMTTIRAVLQKQYLLLEASDGEKGLKAALTGRPSLILLDMSLPNMDGYEVVRSMKANPETCHIPVIALTAHAMKGDRERMIEAGCDDYIAKPIDPDEVVKKIGYWVEK